MVGYSYKITASLSNGIPSSLSNYIDGSKGNGIYELYEIMEQADGNAETAARLLNAHKYTYDKYEPFKSFNGGFILRVTDYFGNKHFMTVKKEDK